MALIKNKKYYSVEQILKLGASYNMIFGERSNGKTYATLYKGLERYFEEGKQIAYIRRYRDDIKGRNGGTLFNTFIHNGNGENVIKKLSKGKWDDVYYYSGRYFFRKTQEDGSFITDNKEFAYSFSINTSEHYKSNSYPFIGTIVFDEFIPIDGVGLPDEFMLFMNLLSTIIRDPSRTDVLVFMVANTINWDSPYFKEFGLNNIRNMKQGTIDFYRYGDSNTSLAVEYCQNNVSKESKENDRFFAFDNPHLKMITEGTWEMDLYPHCPCYYSPKDVLFKYFIHYNDDLLQADVVFQENKYFTYIHKKTGEVKFPDEDIIFTNLEHSPQYNIRTNLFRPEDRLGQRLLKFYKDNKVFYQDNVVGQIIDNYKA